MPDLPYLVNCSMLFTEVPLLQRPAAAKAAGFDTVEFWWPWPDQPAPGDADVDAFVEAVDDSGVHLAGLNFFAGDLAGPDCGVLSVPTRSSQFRDNIDVTVGIGERLGTKAFNALYGNRVDGATPQEQDELGVENIILAAKAADRVGATVLVEPVSGPKPYPLRTAGDAVGVVERARAAAPRTSASSATCSTSPTTVTTSTRPSPGTPTVSRTCRSPTPPGVASPAPATCRWSGGSPTSRTPGTTGGWVWSTSRPPRRSRACAGWRTNAAAPTRS